MSSDSKKKGRKNLKYGRAGRKPSHIRYNVEKRWETNKARKKAKNQKRAEKLKARKEKKKD